MAISLEQIELRAHPRTEASGEVSCTSERTGITLQGTVVDRSPAGLGLLLPDALVPGDSIRIEELGRKSSRRGEVRWIRQQHDGYRVGIRLEPEPSGRL